MRHEATTTHARRATDAARQGANETAKAGQDVKNKAASAAEDVRHNFTIKLIFPFTILFFRMILTIFQCQIHFKVTQKAKDAAGTVADTAQDLTEKAKQTAQDAWGTVKDTTQKIKETVVGKAEDSKESVKKNAETVKRSMNMKTISFLAI